MQLSIIASPKLATCGLFVEALRQGTYLHIELS